MPPLNIVAARAVAHDPGKSGAVAHRPNPGAGTPGCLCTGGMTEGGEATRAFGIMIVESAGRTGSLASLF
jgi:hypothetical protein